MAFLRDIAPPNAPLLRPESGTYPDPAHDTLAEPSTIKAIRPPTSPSGISATPLPTGPRLRDSILHSAVTRIPARPERQRACLLRCPPALPFASYRAFEELEPQDNMVKSRRLSVPCTSLSVAPIQKTLVTAQRSVPTTTSAKNGL